MTCGIYVIENANTGARYIGSSVNMRRRRKEHFVALRQGKHPSGYLQNSFSKHGEAAFSFRPLLECGTDDLLYFEQRAMDVMQPEYNVAAVAGSSRGIKRSAESVARLSAIFRAGRNAKYEWGGRMVSLIEISEETGASHKTLISRVIGQGKTVEEAVSVPVRELGKDYEHDGRSMPLKDWAVELGMHPRRLAYWLSDGLTIADCISRLNRVEKAMSIREFAMLWGVPYQTLRSRMKKAASIADCLHEPREMDNSWRAAA